MTAPILGKDYEDLPPAHPVVWLFWVPTRPTVSSRKKGGHRWTKVVAKTWFAARSEACRRLKCDPQDMKAIAFYCYLSAIRIDP